MKKCGATIEFGDDYGDNQATFHCKLPKGHKGEHEEKGSIYGQPYRLTWVKDRRRMDLLEKRKLEREQAECPHDDIQPDAGAYRWCQKCGKEFHYSPDGKRLV